MHRDFGGYHPLKDTFFCLATSNRIFHNNNNGISSDSSFTVGPILGHNEYPFRCFHGNPSLPVLPYSFILFTIWKNLGLLLF